MSIALIMGLSFSFVVAFVVIYMCFFWKKQEEKRIKRFHRYRLEESEKFYKEKKQRELDEKEKNEKIDK